MLEERLNKEGETWRPRKNTSPKRPSSAIPQNGPRAAPHRSGGGDRSGARDKSLVILLIS